MRNTDYSLLLILSVFVLMGCGKTGPDLAIKEIWSRPVEMVKSCNHASNGDSNTKPACCAKDSESTEKPACCTNGANGVNGVVYMQIKNNGDTPDILIAAKSEIADFIEIHETKMENGRMSMQKVQDGIEIQAGETIALKPGGYHVMLIGMKQSLKVDDEFELKLQFQESGEKIVSSRVQLFK